MITKMKRKTLTACRAIRIFLLTLAGHTAAYGMPAHLQENEPDVVAAAEAFATGEGTTLATLSLDSCRSMALRQGKTMMMANMEKQKAHYNHQAARANYLPKFDFIGTYQRTSKPISILSEEQQEKLSTMGSTLVGGMQQNIAASGLPESMQQLAAQLIAANPELAPLVQQGQQMAGQYGQAFAGGLAQTMNLVGEGIVDAFDTDTRNAAIMSVMFTQPLYMGGKIRAYDRITRYSEELAGEKLRAEEQEIVLEVDKAYWQVVSLVNKKRLAQAYRDMLQHLDDDVKKMISEGVATRANELTVSVKLNEAEMTLMRIEDGLTLSRMLLAQLCGYDMTLTPALADEKLEGIASVLEDVEGNVCYALAKRPELRQLRLATDIYTEKMRIERSAFLPQLALTGGYATTYPALFNGFERHFRGMWNVGVSLKLPLWHWGEGLNKVRAARTEAAIASLRHEETSEKVELQVRQTAFAVNEANRKVKYAEKNMEKAEENLRVARIGFAEGVIATSDLLTAQTAWVGAQSDLIDARIDIMLTRSAYKKALGN